MPSKAVSTYLLYNRLHNKRFDKELKQLSTRASNVLRTYDIDSYDQLYDQLFIKNNLQDFRGLRNVGLMTQYELINFTRRVIDPQGRFTEYVRSFNESLSGLSPRARGVLRQSSISLFETYFFQMIIKHQKKDFSRGTRSGPETVIELDKFHQKFCELIDVKSMKPKNRLKYPLIENNTQSKGFRKAQSAFNTGYKSLSRETKKVLSDMEANSMDGFYDEFISEYSQLSLLLTKMGPDNLMEVLKLRTICNNILKESKDS